MEYLKMGASVFFLYYFFLNIRQLLFLLQEGVNESIAYQSFRYVLSPCIRNINALPMNRFRFRSITTFVCLVVVFI